MRLVAFDPEGETTRTPNARFGALLPLGGEVLDVARALGGADGTAQPRSFPEWFDTESDRWRRVVDLFGRLSADDRALEALRRAGAVMDLSAVRLLAPVPRPGKVVCIGLNYRDHARESGMAIPERPVVFSKFSTSVIGPERPVVTPAISAQVDYEAELAVVIGRCARRVPKESALDHVLGYTNFNDVSARDLQFADSQWQRGKSCDTFGPMGPYLVTADEVKDPHRLAIRLRLNGQTMQDSNTDQLIFGIAELIAFLTESITLEPGDVIATGTPPGVGFARKPPVFLKPGDVMEVEVEGLGVLRNPVSGEAR
jgi:2-keto-4-pentenoate hydratase/2-oxohepta-3-ene-1,7-dioic acid hydratase in catechol pathway